MSPIQHAGRSRRGFIKKSGILAAGFTSFNIPSWVRKSALPFYKGKLPVHNIPADKKLDPEWIKSLYQRGTVTRYLKSKNELRYIGMPAGGLHTGTVYLGGDGRLWLWGIYNDDREGVDPKTVLWNDGTRDVTVRNRDGAGYVEPAIAGNKRVLEQGFAIRFTYAGKTVIKELKEEDWEEIIFEATYPVASIKYIDTDLPFSVTVNAGALFIPLDADHSALPATVFNITVTNKSNGPATVSVCGWLENGAHKITGKDEEGVRQNQAIQENNYSAVFEDFRSGKPDVLQQRDAGTTCIALMEGNGRINTDVQPWPVDTLTFSAVHHSGSERAPSGKLIGSVTADRTIAPGSSAAVNFVLSWHFNHPLQKLQKMKDTGTGYWYGKQFKDALAVTRYIAQRFEELHAATLLWKTTFYDSTLPYWFLERTFLNIGTLATANTYRFASDRFWGWEGVNACEGTCTHVWHYAQAVGRLFPSLERDVRQRTDLGIGMQESGGILFRGEFETRPAIDGQAGRILGCYREHQMSKDNAFLQHNWEQIKKAVKFLLAQDKNGDGMTDTPMENTLDAIWEGEIAWIVGLSIAAIKAAQYMAGEMNDPDFAQTCRRYVEKGNRNMADKLFNGSYFIHRPDPLQGRKKLGSYNTCHIDQVFGQSWAWQVGLGRLWDKEKTLSALQSLWKYNFAPDVGPYIQTHTGGRPYALEGEAGMILNTNPSNEARPYGDNVTWQLGYFHECMSGFEHQVSSHMMAEGMTDEALVLTRAVHDRYHAAKRNPFNEIECSDHYARAMASYGTFITACGFEYHGPKGYICFSPKWNKDAFKAPFTVAEGWGTYTQKVVSGIQEHQLHIKYGTLKLKQIKLERVGADKIRAVTAIYKDTSLALKVTCKNEAIIIEWEKPVILQQDQPLKIRIT